MKERSLHLSLLVLLILLWFSCSDNAESPVIDCSGSELSISIVSQVNSDCSDPGSITVAATGGTSPYQFSANGLDFQSSATLEGLVSGNYEITVRDTDGCSSSISTVLEAEPGSVTLSVSSTESQCGSATGTITATATGGVEPYSFSLNNGTSQATGIFTGVAAGSNEVKVVDAVGCEVSREIPVESEISLSSDVMIIISTNCAVTGCHNGSRSPDLRTRSSIISNAGRIKTRTGNRTMPPADRNDLSQADINKIACWVDSGAPNN